MDADQIQASCASEGKSNVKFHAVRRVHGEYGYWAAYCGAGADGTTMMSDNVVPAESIKPEWQCRRPACRKGFAEADIRRIVREEIAMGVK